MNTVHPPSVYQRPPQARRRSTRRRRIGFALLLIGLIGVQGCGWWAGRRLNIQHYETRDQSPRPPEELMALERGEQGLALTPATRDLASTPSTPTEDQRGGSPAGWGESARLLAGRQFDPIYFEAGSDEIDARGQRQLRDYAAWLANRSAVWFLIAGHTDPADSLEFAYSLAMARALAVRDYLAMQGIGVERLYPISFGGDQPTALGQARDAVALNNRVEPQGFLAPEGMGAPQPVAARSDDVPPVAPPTPIAP